MDKVVTSESKTSILSKDKKSLGLDLLKKQLTDILNSGAIQITPYASGQGVMCKRGAINWLVNYLAKKEIRLRDNRSGLELRPLKEEQVILV